MIHIDSLIEHIAPHSCLGCGRNGPLLCSTCSDEYFEQIQPRCVGCKRLSDHFKVCTNCRSWLPLQSVRVSANYEGIAEALVHSLKFDCRRAAAGPIAQLMASQIVDSDGTLLCPIPTAPSRVRQRGFDHALHITKRLSRHTKVPYQQLLRRHTNVRQLGASRLNRIRQMEREFEAIKQGEIKGKHVILVDDVFTTGATLSAAAKVLRKAGARRVSAVVFAQKV